MESMLINAVYLLTGAFGGTIIGALGSGSSLVILPLLTLTFAHIFPESLSLNIAVATCMATLVVGSFSGAVSYAKSGLYDKQLVTLCLPGILIGALIAPQLSALISPSWLRLYIGLLLSGIAVYKLLQSARHQPDTVKSVQPVLLVLVSIVCAILSGLAGVALGILMIPFLSRYASHQITLGTNLLLAVPYSMVGTAGYIMTGWHLTPAVGETPFLLGYIYLPAFLAIALTIGLFPPLGLKLAKKVGNTIMQRVFYGYLLLAGISMLL
ncbi:sulfite exporter TauE/SafE family protein [Photobacterium japonica]|uniref:sulfite exporter TauE/SafE family protein n=1 Tax=Photobacterium japonica TaxID=2910235 RepID=UPI003D10337F